MVVWLQLCICLAFAAAANIFMRPFTWFLGPADFASFLLIIIAFSVFLARSSLIKGLAMATVGLLLSCVGTDIESYEKRLTFGVSQLTDGIMADAILVGCLCVAVPIRALETNMIPIWLKVSSDRIPRGIRRWTGPALVLCGSVLVYAQTSDPTDVLIARQVTF
jgi:TctA family transporter